MNSSDIQDNEKAFPLSPKFIVTDARTGQKGLMVKRQQLPDDMTIDELDNLLNWIGHINMNIWKSGRMYLDIDHNAEHNYICME